VSRASVAAIFEEPGAAIEAVEVLVRLGLDLGAVGLVMSGRTAERHFSVRWRTKPKPAVRLSATLRDAARRLHPLAPASTPGGGVVGMGPVTSKLARAGLGSACGLAEALERLGLAPGDARAVAHAVSNGSVLVCTEPASVAANDDFADVGDGLGGATWTLVGEDE
jgi:hypothetical protein